MKNIFYQATSYTTDHCDGDLIAPIFWNPTKDRSKSAKEIIDEVIADLCHIAAKKQPGPSFITVEYRKNEHDNDELCEPGNTDWCEPVQVKQHLTRRSKFIQKLETGLADGSIGTVLLTQPGYVNFHGVQMAEYKNVYHIQEFTIPGKRKA